MTLKSVLGLSLLINIALISFIATQTISNANDGSRVEIVAGELSGRGSRGDRHGLPRELRGLAHLEVLSEDQRDAVRAVIQNQLPAVREKGDKAREASRAFRRALGDADTNDTAARALAEAMVSARRDHQDAATTLLLDAMAVLPPEARQKLAEQGRQHRERRRERRRGHEHGGSN